MQFYLKTRSPPFEAPLSFALIEYPNLDISKELSKIDHVTEEARKRIKAPSNPDEPILLLNDYFFDKLGIRANIDNLIPCVISRWRAGVFHDSTRVPGSPMAPCAYLRLEKLVWILLNKQEG